MPIAPFDTLLEVEATTFEIGAATVAYWQAEGARPFSPSPARYPCGHRAAVAIEAVIGNTDGPEQSQFIAATLAECCVCRQRFYTSLELCGPWLI